MTHLLTLMSILLLFSLAACARTPLDAGTTLETNFRCFRFYPAMWQVTTPAPPAPGNRVAHTNDEWQKLWHHLRYEYVETPPPVPLLPGSAAIATTVKRSQGAHIHIRRIEEGMDSITVETQLEVRTIPQRVDGAFVSVSDDPLLESLIVIYPNVNGRAILFKELPQLVWTTRTEADALAPSTCTMQ